MTSMQNAEALARCTGARSVTYDDGRGDVATAPDTGSIVRRLILSRARLLESGFRDTDARRAWMDASRAYRRATGRQHPQGARWDASSIPD